MNTEQISQMKRKLCKLWSIWCKAMGNKISDNNAEADVAAIIRTVFWVVQLITCAFIILNAGRNLKYW